MRSNSVRWVVVLGVCSVVGIVGVQAYWVRQAFDSTERQFGQSLYVALKNVATQLARYQRVASPADQPVAQVSTGYYLVNVNTEINADVLEYYLATEFNRANLRMDYEYAIYDCATDRMVYGKYVPARVGNLVVLPPARPGTELLRWQGHTYYFGLSLPNHAQYLVSRLNSWLFTSAMVGVVVAFFAYALFVILRQKQLSEIQRDFVNNLTHEFKTPLSTIAIAAEVLANPAHWSDAPRMRRYAGIVRDENRRLHQHVERVLQVARTGAPAFQLHKAKVDVHALIGQVADGFEPTNQHGTGRLTTELAAAHACALADPLHLANALRNLLDNARQYTPLPPHIVVSTRNQGHRLLIAVTDNGVGITRADQRRVFDQFFRVPRGQQPGVVGFGLGLHYVRNVARRHGWQVQLASEPGRGSIFTLVINHLP